MNILVRNLSRAVTERELLQLFLPFGKVKSLNIVTDAETSKSKGFGFVDMPAETEAAAAIKALDGKLIHGEKIRVKKTARESTPPTQYRPDRMRTEHVEGRGMKKLAQGERSGTRGTKQKQQRPKRKGR
ncbi:MAG: RNA recognition motif domain-containing protein [Nitrospirota bacterium]